ncbi:uncharacterized protein PAE49_005493 [Odontesthes bonariensis]|uniref:uncharacterized protein LOC142380474 n=1 Tax=Odontesthes bonariensis TaxID=219752 RepID=UPI003F58F734
MSSFRFLTELISERPTREIFTDLRKTDEEELRVLDISWKPEIKLQKRDLPQQHVYKREEVLMDRQLCKQERNSSPDVKEPQPSTIKEEQEELCISQDLDQPVVKQEYNIVTVTYEESDQSEPEHEHQNHEELNRSDTGIANISPMSRSQCNPGTVSDFAQQHVCKQKGVLVDQQPCKQERNLSLDQREPQSSYVKEEQDDLCISQDLEQPVLKQEYNIITVTYEESDHSEPEPECQDQERHNRSDCSNADISPTSKSPCYTGTGEKSLQCEFCGKAYKSRSKLKAHYRVHTGEKPYSCKTCGKRFSSSSALYNHLNTHTDERPYFCETCGKGFRVNEKLLIHMRTHTGERPYSCKTCGKSFTQNGNLTVHMRTHTGERPYPCKTCGKRFSNNGDLLRHLSTHTGERPYSCQTCGKRFTQNGSLTAHMRTHTGERPYLCETCGKRFCHNRDLLVHITTQHQ